jgi:hypothetical protein
MVMLRAGLFDFAREEENPLSNITYTDKKENKIFLIYKEIQSGAVAKSYMRKGFLIYEEMRIEENLIFFFISVQTKF